MQETTRIFLSHKGCDKPLVRRFKAILEQIGFQPWLDEDAMHAGVELERGILNGFKESCAAVFFITPSFVDERYLATEVDYAIQQKREKGDRFAVVTLSLLDSGGNRGQVPELLRKFVWKSPDDDLITLWEILRALPLQPGAIQWKGISSHEASNNVSTESELSDEAKNLLLEAVQDRHGTILATTTSSGFQVQTRGNAMVPSQDAKTVATWREAVKELQAANAIERRGKKGEVFQVTKRGHQLAEQIISEGLAAIPFN